MAFQGPKGTRDFYPEDMQVLSYITNTWRRTARLFGFEEYEGPMFEHLDLFTKKSGEEIVKQLYNFKDKGDRDIALRPEITPTLARMVAARGPELKKPLKWFSIPRLFRYERTQKGRLREFIQLNLDILGEQSVAADAELIAAAVHMLKAFGLTENDFQIRVNSRQLMAEMLHDLGFPVDKLTAAFSVLDKKDKIDATALTTLYVERGILEAEQAILERVLSCSSFDSICSLVPDPAALPAIEDMKNFLKRISMYGLSNYVSYDVSIIRGLAYYTGIVYEVFDTSKKLRAIAGGGRYNGLVEQFGGEFTPAVGFGMGDVVLHELLMEKGLMPKYHKPVDVYIVNFNKDDPGPAISFGSLLREQGIAAEFSLKGQNIKKQMENAEHAAAAVFVGGDEWAKNLVKIKNMKTGEETIVEKTASLPVIKNLIIGSAA